MDDTKIEWADDTANPWWGCVKVSPACANCYAAGVAERFHGPGLWGPNADRRLRLDAFERDLERIARRGEREGRPRRVFIASMGDVFEDRPDLIEPRKRVWDVLHRLDGRVIPMLLTKRPDLMAEWAQSHGWPAGGWAGTTVEDQQRADERIPALLQVPAAVRFLSCEPLLGPVDLAFSCFNGADSFGTLPGISWVIVGGESGSKARPMHPAWARSLRDQCQEAGVPFLFKQWGSTVTEAQAPDDVVLPGRSFDVWGDGEPDVYVVDKHAAGRLLDGRTWDEVPAAGEEVRDVG